MVYCYCLTLQLPSRKAIIKKVIDMGYKFTIDLDGDQTDNIVLAALKDSYEDCIKTMCSVERQIFDPLEDVLERHIALLKVIEYYSVPVEHKKYVKYWENYLKVNLKDLKQKVKKADEKVKTNGDGK